MVRPCVSEPTRHLHHSTRVKQMFLAGSPCARLLRVAALPAQALLSPCNGSHHSLLSGTLANSRLQIGILFAAIPRPLQSQGVAE